MAIKDEIKEQTNKLKDMSTKEKTEYIWAYYKWWIMGAIVAVMVIISVARSVISNSRPVYLDAMFLNSSIAAYESQCTLEEEFMERYGINPSVYNMNFDYVTTLTDDYGDQASYAGQIKMMSKYSAEQLDIICGQESIMTEQADEGSFYDLSKLMSEDKLKEVENKGYELFYHTEKIYDDDIAADEDIPYTEGETYIAGIYIDKCDKLVGDKPSCVYSESGEDRWVLSVAWNTKNPEHAIEFINFVTE